MTLQDVSARHTLLVLDSSPDSIQALSAKLGDRYQLIEASSAEACLLSARAQPAPDLILLKAGADALAACEQLQAEAATAVIPVILLTGDDFKAQEEEALRAGVADLLPASAPALLVQARVNVHLRARRGAEIEAVQEGTMLAMAMLAETRDMDTGNHIRRTQLYVKVLAEHLARQPKFASVLSPQTIDMLFRSAPLHDIGKVGIPDRIVLKPGRLDADEFEVMKTHTTIGLEAIEQAEKAMGKPMPYLQVAKDIAYSHQEKWDGSGYPQGLAGEAIPLAARLMTVADVYDALISTRVYKASVPHDEAVKTIFLGRAQHFDPDIVDAFIEIQDEFAAIAARFVDDESQMQQKMEYMIRAIAEEV
jgi:putative two-component system response regulator